MLPATQQAQNIILSQESRFIEINSAPQDINFKREAGFAVQHLQNNNYACNMAVKNPDSLINAVVNVAAIGISLNPASRYAYLVPRDNKIMLDISYMGLLWLAQESGAISWGQAKIVYSNDGYQSTGLTTEPKHDYSPFGNRGDIIGAYVTVKTSEGDFLTHEMPIDDIYKIRARSQSFKGGKMSPWKTDAEQMILKTVVKQASKYWPKVGRLKAAENYLNNEMSESIDFKSEQEPAVNDATGVQVDKIQTLLKNLGVEWEVVINYASESLNINYVDSPSKLTKDDASKIIDVLEKRSAQHA